MKKIITAIIAIALAIPSFAETISNGDVCDNSVLETTSGSAELNATWDANTIHLDFDPQNGGSHISGTCTYDGGITLPEEPVKTGYRFVKWQKKPLQCTVSTLPTSNIIGEDYGYISATGNVRKADVYELTKNREWAASLQEAHDDYYGPVQGIIRGTSLCSAIAGRSYGWQLLPGTSSDWSATYEELTSVGDGRFCWCHATSYTPTNGEQCMVPANSRWVHNYGYGSATTCAASCAYQCGIYARDYQLLRARLFGQTN